MLEAQYTEIEERTAVRAYGGDKHVRNGPGACDHLLWTTAAAICFMKPTLGSPAQHHIARLATFSRDHHHSGSECVSSILMHEVLVTARHQQRGNVVFPLSRAAVQMQVLEGSAL